MADSSPGEFSFLWILPSKSFIVESYPWSSAIAEPAEGRASYDGVNSTPQSPPNGSQLSGSSPRSYASERQHIFGTPTSQHSHDSEEEVEPMVLNERAESVASDLGMSGLRDAKGKHIAKRPSIVSGSVPASDDGAESSSPDQDKPWTWSVWSRLASVPTTKESTSRDKPFPLNTSSGKRPVDLDTLAEESQAEPDQLIIPSRENKNGNGIMGAGTSRGVARDSLEISPISVQTKFTETFESPRAPTPFQRIKASFMRRRKNKKQKKKQKLGKKPVEQTNGRHSKPERANSTQSRLSLSSNASRIQDGIQKLETKLRKLSIGMNSVHQERRSSTAQPTQVPELVRPASRNINRSPSINSREPGSDRSVMAQPSIKGPKSKRAAIKNVVKQAGRRLSIPGTNIHTTTAQSALFEASSGSRPQQTSLLQVPIIRPQSTPPRFVDSQPRFRSDIYDLEYLPSEAMGIKTPPTLPVFNTKTSTNKRVFEKPRAFFEHSDMPQSAPPIRDNSPPISPNRVPSPKVIPAKLEGTPERSDVAPFLEQEKQAERDEGARLPTDDRGLSEAFKKARRIRENRNPRAETFIIRQDTPPVPNRFKRIMRPVRMRSSQARRTSLSTRKSNTSQAQLSAVAEDPQAPSANGVNGSGRKRSGSTIGKSFTRESLTKNSETEQAAEKGADVRLPSGRTRDSIVSWLETTSTAFGEEPSYTASYSQQPESPTDSEPPPRLRGALPKPAAVLIEEAKRASRDSGVIGLDPESPGLPDSDDDFTYSSVMRELAGLQGHKAKGPATGSSRTRQSSRDAAASLDSVGSARRSGPSVGDRGNRHSLGGQSSVSAALTDLIEPSPTPMMGVWPSHPSQPPPPDPADTGATSPKVLTAGPYAGETHRGEAPLCRLM